MDINRPFGDGVDNNGNGVVDDPLEAGEPFLDKNGNGKWDSGEPWIDPSMATKYIHSLAINSDRRTMAEPITFDYTNGVAVPVHSAVVLAPGLPVLGGVGNLDAQGRQQYARNLYCLMLLLVDENYIAPWDENDPQVMTWMENEKKKLTGAPYRCLPLKRILS